jgi:hypothetical protein
LPDLSGVVFPIYRGSSGDKSPNYKDKNCNVTCSCLIYQAVFSLFIGLAMAINRQTTE